MGYIENCINGKTPDFIEGFTAGLKAFAWWNDGEQQVGSCGTTLKSVMADIYNYEQTHPRNYKAE